MENFVENFIWAATPVSYRGKGVYPRNVDYNAAHYRGLVESLWIEGETLYYSNGIERFSMDVAEEARQVERLSRQAA
jgi:hypothetical protein